jgi:hypothetical protein
MKTIFCILAIGIMAAVFGQMDSSNIPVTAKITHHLKPIDTTLGYSEMYANHIVAKNKTLKIRIGGTFNDTVFLRVFDAKAKPMASGDTLKMDSMQVQVVARVVKVWGLRSIGGLISESRDSTIVQAPRP